MRFKFFAQWLPMLLSRPYGFLFYFHNLMVCMHYSQANWCPSQFSYFTLNTKTNQLKAKLKSYKVGVFCSGASYTTFRTFWYACLVLGPIGADHNSATLLWCIS
ncbi:hypothetical protein I3843_07G076300 [Carya illinoinensis]|uniref:Uncharacterized protein n=1 Tax=Carya illinoinensis TaxID=32201 RepID=A0A922EK39_CARIL|nr:hypothetical protein I3842_07G079300 [Carya illinoinensis]KAG7970299.1 hypothetical protein I3843_07G076300 [Carya illinoinensis]